MKSNTEDAIALSALAKINLNKHNYNEALVLAEQAYDMASEEPSVMNALVVTYRADS